MCNDRKLLFREFQLHCFVKSFPTLSCPALLSLSLAFLLDSVGEEVREVLEEVRVVGEESGDLLEDVLDAKLPLPVSAQDLKELLVDLRLVGEALLDGGDIRDGVVNVGLVGLVRGGALLDSEGGREGLGNADYG